MAMVNYSQSAENKRAKLKEIADKLEQGAKDIFKSDLYREYLKTMASFHTYSYRNSLLIFLQNPDATYVAGFNRWKELGRTVGRGQKGLEILAPAPYKKWVEVTHDEQGNPLSEPQKKQITVPAFKVAYVFDVSQTHGKELPTLAKRLTGDVPEFNVLFAALQKASPFPISFETIDRESCNGYCNFAEQRIAIREGLSQQQVIKTAIHEIAHALMHADRENKPDRQTAEVQAESVAFIVSDYFGIDTSDYSFGYVAGWSSGKELKELGDSMNDIQQQAHTLIGGIEQQLELVKEQSRSVPSKPPMGALSQMIWDRFMENEPAQEQPSIPFEERLPKEPQHAYKSVLDEKIALVKEKVALQGEPSFVPRSRNYNYDLER